MNFNDLTTRLDPSYRAKIGYLQEEMQVKAQFERFRADEAMRREQYKAQEENNRLSRRFSYESQLEQQNHENRLLQLEESIKGSILKSGFDLMADFVRKSAEEDAQRRRHTQEQLTIRTNLRADVFKMVMEAAIKEKLAQKQHQRDIELRELDHKHNQENRVWAMTEAYLLKTYETNGEQATKREIDKLVSEWERTA